MNSKGETTNTMISVYYCVEISQMEAIIKRCDYQSLAIWTISI